MPPTEDPSTPPVETPTPVETPAADPAPAPLETPPAEEPAARAPSRIARALAIFGGSADPSAKALADMTTAHATEKSRADQLHTRLLNMESLLTAASERDSSLRAAIASVLPNAIADITPAELTQALNKKIAAQVVTDIAMAGIPASTLPQATSADSKVETKTRAEFDQLTPSAQSDFFKSGGKLTE